MSGLDDEYSSTLFEYGIKILALLRYLLLIKWNSLNIIIAKETQALKPSSSSQTSSSPQAYKPQAFKLKSAIKAFSFFINKSNSLYTPELCLRSLLFDSVTSINRRLWRQLLLFE